MVGCPQTQWGGCQEQQLVALIGHVTNGVETIAFHSGDALAKVRSAAATLRKGTARHAAADRLCLAGEDGDLSDRAATRAPPAEAKETLITPNPPTSGDYLLALQSKVVGDAGVTNLSPAVPRYKVSDLFMMSQADLAPESAKTPYQPRPLNQAISGA